MNYNPGPQFRKTSGYGRRIHPITGKPNRLLYNFTQRRVWV